LPVQESIQLIQLLPESEVKKLLKQNRLLLDIVNTTLTPIESDLQQINSAFLFFNHKSYLLSINSSPHFKEVLESYQVQIGGLYQLKEDDYYNPSVGLNISLRKLIDGNKAILGYLCIISMSEAFSTCRVLLKSLAGTIETGVANQLANQNLEESNQYAFAIMNNLSSAVITIDLSDRIHWINDTACRILNIRRAKLLNKPIEAYFPQWDKVKRIIHNNLNFTDEESSFDHKDTRGNFLFNAYSIKSPDNLFIGYILTFRSFSRAFQTMEKLRGMQARYRFEDVIFQSDIMARIVDYAYSIAKNSSTVLIEGESGTGKEVFAQSIHNSSDRVNQPFLAINCGAISPNLIEAELFGYEEGAFTGAQKGGRIGKFEQANGGTLFLDEIGEMPLEMQVKLLRALQEKCITRVGASKAIPVDVRIISATNRSLEDEVAAGHFRQDLFFRLNVLPLKIPPLRERKEDLMQLFKFFLQIKAEKFNKALPAVSPELENTIMHYDWPGNVRELENFCERLLIVGEIGLNAILDNSYRPGNISAAGMVLESPDAENTTTQSLENLEKESIRLAIERENYNLTRTAKLLGIGRNTLYLKIKKYNLSVKRG